MGWLIDPDERGIFIYQPGQEFTCAVKNIQTLGIELAIADTYENIEFQDA